MSDGRQPHEALSSVERAAAGRSIKNAMEPTGDKRPHLIVTLVMVHEGGRVLLSRKKEGFGGGLWNGYGGKVQLGETIEDAARRELMEEAGIDVKVLKKAGLLYFDIEGDERLHEGHIFRASGVIGEPLETDEMITPQWFDESEIPYDKMWKGDDAWLPLFLQGKQFEGVLTFNAKHKLLSAVVRAME